MSIKNKFGDLIEELTLECPSPGKHAARNAIKHISKAWEIKDADKEMAMFRAITAEEESATAVFHSVMRRKYNGASKLDIKSHVHKTALHPFLLAVGKVLAETYIEGGYSPKLECDESQSPKRLKARISVNINGNEKWVYSEPPLNFSIKLNNKIYDFQSELDSISSKKKTKNISRYVTNLAKRRNDFLYSRSEGIPTLSSEIEPFLIYRESVIYTNLVIYLMIDPYKEGQLLVQQGLDSFLKILPHVRGCINKSVKNHGSRQIYKTD